MTTSTIAPPIGRHRIPRAELNATQTRVVLDVLDRLGNAHGLAEDEPAIPYEATAERHDISGLAAWMIGLDLTPGHEIAQCYECADIVDGARTEETDGRIRCNGCHHDHVVQRAPNIDLWADFYTLR